MTYGQLIDQLDTRMFCLLADLGVVKMTFTMEAVNQLRTRFKDLYYHMPEPHGSECTKDPRVVGCVAGIKCYMDDES